MRKRWLLALLAGGVVGGVYGSELSFVVADRFGPDNAPFWEVDKASPQHKKEMVALATSFGARMDTRDRSEVVNDLRARGVNAVLAVRLEEIEGSKLGTVGRGDVAMIGGISNSPTVLCNESGEYVTYDSDEHGFRNPRGIWRLSRADLAIVGESFAQGDCVPDGKSFADLLRTAYPATLNLGSSGESALLQLASLREYLQVASPKVVLWVFSEGIDLTVLRRTEAPSALLRRYLDETFSQKLIDRQLEIDTILRRDLSDIAAQDSHAPAARTARTEFIDDAESIVKLWDLRRWFGMTYGSSDRAASLSESNVRVFSDALTQARDMTARWGGTLYIVYLPSWDRYKNGSPANELERRLILNVVESLRIPLIDLHPPFEAYGDPLSLFPFRRFGHYNEAGYRVVADTILHALAVRNNGVAGAAYAPGAPIQEPRR